MPYRGKFTLTSIQQRNREPGRDHGGVDLVGVGDKTLVAVCHGTVEFVGWQNNDSASRSEYILGAWRTIIGQGYGYHVKLRSTDGKLVVYGHMAANSSTLKRGQTVSPGMIVGTEGSTGRSTGSHCHFEVQTVVWPDGAAKYIGIQNSKGTYEWSGSLGNLGVASGYNFPVHVEYLSGDETGAAGITSGRHTLIDLKTMTEFEVYLGWKPYNGYHTDFTPMTRADAAQMIQNAGGKWNWTGRPCVLRCNSNNRLFAVGIHSRPHGSMMGPARDVGYGITSRSNSGPPWPEWGGHMCMYHNEASPGGTLGARAAAREAYELANSGGLLFPGGGTYQPLYNTHNTREDATMREVSSIDLQYKPSINMSIGQPRLSVVNYTSMLSLMFSNGPGGAEYSDYGEVFTGDINAEATKNAKLVYQFFKQNFNFSNNNIAGILGNWFHESNIDPTAIETIYTEPFSVAGPNKQAAISAGYRMSIMNPSYHRRFPAINLCGIGLGQWTDVNPGPGGRNSMLRAFANKIGQPWWRLDTQLRFITTPQSEGGDSQWCTNFLLNWQPEASPGDAANSFLKRWEGMVESTWGTVNAAGRRNVANRFAREMVSW